MQRMLRPRATLADAPEAFWQGWRLLALDGTQFSVTNAPAVKRRPIKARTRRGRAAFAKLPVAVLLEGGAAQSHRRRGGRARRGGVHAGADAAARDPRAGVGAGGPLVWLQRRGGVFAPGGLRAGGQSLPWFVWTVVTVIRLVESLADGSRVLVVPVSRPDRPRRTSGR